METLPPEITAYVIGALLLSWALMGKWTNGGYRCPACGTSNAREHSKDCSWSKHYGDEI